MNNTQKIESLRKEISNLENQIKNCKHDFLEARYNPETVKNPVFSHYEGRGSDPNPVYVYNDKTMDRWSRECKLCGKIEYTYKLEPVISKYQPKF